MRAWLRQAAPWVRRVRDLFPLTMLGASVALGSLVAVLRYGLVRFDLVLLAAGMVGLSLVVLAALFTGFAAWRLHRHERRAREDRAPDFEGECDHTAWTEFRVPRPRVPFVTLTWAWVAPPAAVAIRRERSELTEEARVSRRHRAPTVRRRFVVGDAFGLAEVAFEREERRAVTFSPSTGALRELTVVRSLAGGDAFSHPEAPLEGERIDMRRYAVGDPIRFVLWKVFARTGELMVRTPERAVAPIEQTVAYLVTGPGDEASAGAARLAVEAGVLGGNWVFGADGARAPVRERRAALGLIVDSARVPEEEAGHGLAAFLRAAGQGPTGRVVLFVPAKDGAWRARVLDALRQFGAGGHAAPLEIVVAVDAVEDPAAKAPLRRWLFRPAEERDRARGHVVVTRAELEALSSLLGPHAADLVVLDRGTGQRLERAWALPSFRATTGPVVFGGAGADAAAQTGSAGGGLR